MTTSSSPVSQLEPSGINPADLAPVVAQLRDTQPLVQCLINVVAANVAANVLLAAGAAPAMIDNPHEAGPTATAAGGVLVNLGTPQEHTAVAMHEAVAAAGRAGTPWVLDPIGAGSLPWRTGVAHDLITTAAPAVIRGNASEIIGLAGGEGGRGVDSVHRPEDALPAAISLARKHGTVVAVSGPVDHLTDGTRLVRIANGSPLLTQVIGVGCALGALMAGCGAVTEPLLAATAATALVTVAADNALASARGPGSFAVGLLDELSSLDGDALAGQVRLS